GEQLQPVARVNPTSITQQVADLADDRFPVRGRAFERLKAAGDQAAPALLRRLADKPTVDEQRQIQELLELAKTWPADQLPCLRALEVLEYIHSAEAKGLVQRMTAGAAESRITQQAKDCLKRLDLFLRDIPPSPTFHSK